MMQGVPWREVVSAVSRVVIADARELRQPRVSPALRTALQTWTAAKLAATRGALPLFQARFHPDPLINN